MPCAGDGSICVVSGEFHQRSSHHTQNMNATWSQGATSGAWTQELPDCFQQRKIPCEIVLFLESLITVDAGEGAVKGARLMGCHMGSVLACDLCRRGICNLTTSTTTTDSYGRCININNRIPTQTDSIDYLECSITVRTGHTAKLLGVMGSLVLLQLVLWHANLATPEKFHNNNSKW